MGGLFSVFIRSSLLTSLMLSLLHVSFVKADIAVVVGEKSPVKSLEVRDAKKIYMGKTRLWPDSREEVLTYDASDPELRNPFYRLLVEMGPSKLARYRASYLFSGKGRLPVEVDSVDALTKRLQAEANSIGYMRVNDVPETLRIILLLKEEH